MDDADIGKDDGDEKWIEGKEITILSLQGQIFEQDKAWKFPVNRSYCS